jgi:hypothetical protein
MSASITIYVLCTSALALLIVGGLALAQFLGP